MERAHVRVKNAAGQDVGSFDDPVSFRTWKREIQKKLGAKLAVAVGGDGVIKFYNVSIFDVSGMIRTPYKDDLGPAAAFVLSDQQSLAVSKPSDNSVLIYDAQTLSSEPVRIVTLHGAPVVTIAYNHLKNVCLTSDKSGIIEYVNCSNSVGGETIGETPVSSPTVSFSSKMDTDLYELAKKVSEHN